MYKIYDIHYILIMGIQNNLASNTFGTRHEPNLRCNAIIMSYKQTYIYQSLFKYSVLPNNKA